MRRFARYVTIGTFADAHEGSCRAECCPNTDE